MRQSPESIANEHVALAYGGAADIPLTLTNKQTDQAFHLDVSCPSFEFASGFVGGHSVMPMARTRHDEATASQIALHYPVQRLGSLGLAIVTIFSLPGQGNIIRKWAELVVSSDSHTDNDGVERLLLQKATVLDQHLSGPVTYAKRDEWQSFPVFTDQLFLGVEFPVACASLNEGRIALSHMPGIYLDPGQRYRTRSVVVGACPQGGVRDAFESYVRSFWHRHESIHFNYNAWWSQHVPFAEQESLQLVETFRRNLYTRYAGRLDSFTADLGWSDRKAIWSIDRTRFPQGFSTLQSALAAQECRLGLWWSPSNCYSPQSFDNEWAKSAGYEVFDAPVSGGFQTAMCLTKGSRYQREAKEALVSIIKKFDVGQVKFDGYAPECQEHDHGHPPGELSREAMADGLIEIFERMREAKPDIWLEPTCFGTSSPWWLRYVDSVTGDFGDDAPYGVVPALQYRESYTTTRDFFNLYGTQRSPAPIAAQEVLGIIHQTPDSFYNDAVTTVLRGHQFLSLYVNPAYLEAVDYTFLAQLMQWARAKAVLLSQTTVIYPQGWNLTEGPIPVQILASFRQTYGYAHWCDGEGIICLRNPWIATDHLDVPLAEHIVTQENAADYSAYQLYPYQRRLGTGLRAGDTLSLRIGPYETRVIALLREANPVAPAPDADPLDEVTAGVTVRAAESTGVRSASGAGGHWRSFIHGKTTTGDSTLYYLIEAPLIDEPAPVPIGEMEILIDGQPVAWEMLDSTGWAACSMPQWKLNSWVWYAVVLPKGEWTASASFALARDHVIVSAWILNHGAPLAGALCAPDESPRTPPFPVAPEYRVVASVPAIPLTHLFTL